MNQNIVYPKNEEFILNIENIQLTILVDKTLDIPINEILPYSDTEQYTRQTFHQHAFSEIFCCPQGFLNINTEDGIISLRKGDIAIIPGGTPHNMLPSSNSNSWASLRFQITKKKKNGSKDLFSSLQRLCCNKPIKVFRNTYPYTDIVAHIFQNITNTEESFSNSTSLINVLLYLSKLQPIPSEVVNLDDFVNQNDSDMQRNEIIDYLIHRCYMYPLTLSLISRKLHISERQISRIVHRAYGMSFHKVLLQKRIHVAEQMLKNSLLPINKIAQIVGFRSPDIFYKEFKKTHLITPSEYRDSSIS